MYYLSNISYEMYHMLIYPCLHGLNNIFMCWSYIVNIQINLLYSQVYMQW